MDKQYESIYHTAEDTNWWFKTRQDFVYRYLVQQNVPSSGRILDIGCGGGGLLSYLRDRGFINLFGIDLSPEAISFCTSRGLASVAIDDAQHVNTMPNESFDIIIASDVLEHLEHASAAMRRWRELLKPSGKLIVFVPAYQALWSERDVLNKHVTRYTEKKLLMVAEAAGLSSVLSSYWNFFMFAPYALLLKLKKHTKNKIVEIQNKETAVNSMLKKILWIENSLILHGARFPFGVSFLAIFKKK